MRMKHCGIAVTEPDSPRRANCTAPFAAKAMIALLIAQCVDTAPLGNPVVPEV